MTPERWQRVTEVFEAAQAAAPGERPRLLARLCGRDRDLIAAVEALLVSDADASGFLAEPPALDPASAGEDIAAAEPDPQWPAGTLLAGRYEIERLLGRGGMGEIYAALDRELSSRVALKVIRQNLAADPRMLARFKREALTARQISHPNVCRVHDLVVASGLPPVYCLSMELIEGESLATWLAAHGPPPVAVARRWLEAIATGLDAAHAAGVLHRDLKPANILLRSSIGAGPGAAPPGGPPAPPSDACGAALLPVIMDFGLARWLQPASGELEASGTQAIGTLAYMAPEQWQGGELTAATDIYGFGLVAFEMLTGKRALSGPGPFGGWLQHIAGLTPNAADAGLDPAWEPFFAATLAADPAHRFASAAAAMAAAPLPASHSPLPTPHFPLPTSSSPSRRARWAISAAALMVLLFLAVVLFRHYQVMATVPAGAQVLLTPVVNDSEDAQLSGVDTMLQQQLAQSAHFEVMSDAAIRNQLQRMGKPASYGSEALAQQPALAREVAMRAGAPLVVFAALTRVAGRYRLEVELERVGHDPDAAARRWTSEQLADQKDDLFDAVHAAATWVRTMAGEAPEVLAATDQPPQDVTTSSWTALEDYTDAERARAVGHTPQAIALLRQATSDDPHFALAYTRLGDILVSEQRGAEGYAAYQQALRPTDLNRLSRRERLRLQGDYDTDVGDYRGAINAFQAYTALYPNDYLGSFYQGYPDAELGQPAKAYAAWQQADAINPRQYFAASNRAFLQIWQGRLDAASVAAALVRRRGSPEYADQVDACIAFVRGNDALARQYLAALARSPDPYQVSTAALLEASLDAERGQYARARARLRRSLAQDAAGATSADTAAKHLALAYLALKAAQPAKVRSEAAAVEALGASPRQLAQLGRTLARAGDLAGARHALALLQPDRNLGPLAVISASRVRGEILLAQHQPAAALRQFQTAAKLGGALDFPQGLPRALAAAGQPLAALRLLDTWTPSPGRIWHDPKFELPGQFADLLFAAARLADQLHAPASAARFRRYLQFRRPADPGLPDVVLARHRLQALNAARH